MLDSQLISGASPISPPLTVRPPTVCPWAVLALVAAGLLGCTVSALLLRHLPILRWAVPVVIIACVTVLGIAVLRRCTRATARHLSRDIDRLERLADSDSLTGIANRRAFTRELEREFGRARRYGYRLAVVFVDLDNFKVINDTYGHAAGDVALQTLASVLAGAVRGSDLAARIGGDEFALLLVQTDEEMARRVVERIQAILHRWPFVLAQDPPVSAFIRVSTGIGALGPTTADPAALLHAADTALYTAKGERRETD